MKDHKPEDDQRALRNLRRLVTVLTIVLIGGMISVVGLMAIRLSAPPVAEQVPIPEVLALPESAKVMFVQRRADDIAVMTEDLTLIVLDPTGSKILYTITPDLARLIAEELQAE